MRSTKNAMFAILLMLCTLGDVSAAQDQESTNSMNFSSITNTIWQVHSRQDKSQSWDKFIQLRFLPNGIVEEIMTADGSGATGCRHKWSLLGNKLRIFTPTAFFEEEKRHQRNVSSLLDNLNVTIKSREMIGTADLGMNPRKFLVWLVLLPTPRK